MYPFPDPMFCALMRPLVATASPTSVGGSRSGQGSVSTNIATVTVSGGTPPYTYAWTSTVGAPEAPSSAATKFNSTISNGGSVSGTATCIVTDSADKITEVTVAVGFSSTGIFAIGITPNNFDYTVVAGQSVSHRFNVGSAFPTGAVTYSWSSTDGAVSPSSGTSTTFTVSGRSAGYSGVFTVRCNASDSSAHNASDTSTLTIKWV